MSRTEDNFFCVYRMLDEETGQIKHPDGNGQGDVEGLVRVALPKHGLVLDFDFGWDMRGNGFQYKSKSGALSFLFVYSQ